MYISGSQYDLENRIHSNSITSGDLINYINEGNSYSNNVPFFLINKWNREISLKSYSLFQDISYYTNLAIPFGNNILDINNSVIYDINGNPIQSF